MNQAIVKALIQSMGGPDKIIELLCENAHLAEADIIKAIEAMPLEDDYQFQTVTFQVLERSGKKGLFVYNTSSRTGEQQIESLPPKQLMTFTAFIQRVFSAKHGK